jgi:hypothetical protein
MICMVIKKVRREAVPLINSYAACGGVTGREMTH